MERQRREGGKKPGESEGERSFIILSSCIKVIGELTVSLNEGITYISQRISTQCK